MNTFFSKDYRKKRLTSKKVRAYTTLAVMIKLKSSVKILRMYF